MKKIFILAIAFIGLSGVSFAQEKTEKKPERIKLVKNGQSSSVKTNDVKQPVKKELSPAEEISRCEATLKALDQKEAWLRSNPNELEIALENNWFKNANETRATLNARIKELKAELK